MVWDSQRQQKRWSRVEECLQDLNFLPQVAENGNPHDYYIPENIFYRLCMKAKNEVAEKFQAKVADEIIPSIRKTGSYSITKPLRNTQRKGFWSSASSTGAWKYLRRLLV